MSFASLSASLKLNIQDFSTKLNEASRRMGSFATTLNRDYGRANAALKSHNLGLKDTARIVQGIVVSQAFYTAANSIAEATRSLWDFNVALDYMQVTYSALFGSSKVASDFMSVLQEHSVDTIFDYQNLADASKKLLAYGIEYENLMFIMEGLTNLGTMSGDSAALDRIALALGQIYTKGKLSAEEMRQLANAYIPITDILQDKFGLTGDDLKRVGDLNLPAADVINAIVDYANENFGSVGDAAMYTITGLQNKIVDTLKVVGAQMLKPITTAYKSFLAYIARGLETLRGEFEAGGIGGIFEYLVPDKQTQQTIRQFIANVRNLFMSLMSVGVVAGQVFGNFAQVLVTAFNIVSPLIIGFVNVLSATLNAMMQTSTGASILRVAIVAAAGAFVVLKAQAAAALVISAVTSAVMGLAKALVLLASLITRHPIIALLAGLAISLVGISAASKSANNSISGLFDTISGAGGGASSGDVLQKVNQGLNDGADAADQFNNRLENAEQSANDLSKAIGGAGGAADKAAKKAAGLLSFDEVFKLNEPKDSTGGGGGGGGGLLDALDNLGAGFGGLGEDLIPDIPDFTEFINGFTEGLFGGLAKGIVDKLKAIGFGALIGGGLGAIIGGLLGGPGGAILGAKIGAFAGGVAGWIWDELEGALTNTLVGAASGIATVISKAFSTSFSGLVSLISKGTSFKNIFSGIGYALKTTGLKSIVKGGIIGAAIGLVVDGIAHLLWSSLENKFSGANSETAKVGQTIGSVIGAVIGGIFGGPAGAIIGSAIGTFAGGFIGLFWDPMKEFFTESIIAFRLWVEDTAAALHEWNDRTLENFHNWVDSVVSGIQNWYTQTTKRIGEWVANTVSSIRHWADDTAKAIRAWHDTAVEVVRTFVSDGIAAIVGFASDTLNSIIQWTTDMYNKYQEFKTTVIEVLVEFCTSAYEAIRQGLVDMLNNTKLRLAEIVLEWKNKWLEIKSTLSTWWTTLISSLETWMNETKAKISAKLTEIKTTWSNKWDEIRTNLSTWWNNLPGSIESWFNTTKTAISNKLDEVKTTWTNKWNEIKSNLSDWWTDIKKSMASWLETGVMQPIKDFFNLNTFWNKISNLLSQIKNKFSNWWKGLFDTDVNVTGSVSGSGGNANVSLRGHASGGVFNREHIARFAEGNKAEAIIPLENPGAMQPFVDAVAGGITSYLAPLMANANSGNSNNLPPLYVGTLIADDRGLRELYRKFEVIQTQENERRGTPNTPVLA